MRELRVPHDAFVAPARMQSHQQIAVVFYFRNPVARDLDLMAEAPQNSAPAIRRDGISKRRAGRLRCDDDDLHESSAQVRRPAQMSERSGV